ncbi:uncharacterized protein LOC124279177 [Haliotis rubra]|uniref:uncharacterized protein LOC124279177 n=1 Tax=Haliotis rubra TaxID=36100 RepID=UPI001EE51C90|nr:uncharacterized protein LOC124279177 [Haliotis rubra]
MKVTAREPRRDPGLGYMDNRRTENTEWCKCGQGIAHPTAEECSCCQENPTTVAKIDEVEREGLPSVNCITQQPGFAGVCCNRWVLQTAYFQYRQQYGEVDVADQAVNRRYRYTGYRQFVRWCCGYLGRKVRVPLPACAVRAIRTEFPSEEFCGFKYPSLE